MMVNVRDHHYNISPNARSTGLEGLGVPRLLLRKERFKNVLIKTGLNCYTSDAHQQERKDRTHCRNEKNKYTC